MLNAEVTKGVADSLPKAGHYDDPAVGFSVDDCLCNMGNSRPCKYNEEKDIGAKVWTEIPQSILLRDVDR